MHNDKKFVNFGYIIYVKKSPLIAHLGKISDSLRQNFKSFENLVLTKFHKTKRNHRTFFFFYFFTFLTRKQFFLGGWGHSPLSPHPWVRPCLLILPLVKCFSNGNKMQLAGDKRIAKETISNVKKENIKDVATLFV